MSSNTVGTRRGSVRGAPPGVYIPFGTYGSDEDSIEAFRPILRFFIHIGQFLICILIGTFIAALFVFYE